MKPEKINQMIKKLNVTTSAELDIRVHDEIEKALAQTKSTTSTASQSNIWRIIMHKRMTQLAAAAAIIIVVFVALNIDGGSIAWADVVKPILSARTLIVDIVVGDEESSPVMHDIIVGSRIRRTISNIPGTVMVIDPDSGKMLALDENGKTAAYIDIEGPLAEGTKNFVEFLREVITNLQNRDDFSVEQLGERVIDGRKVVGFLAEGPQEGVTIWADAESAVPVRIELRAGNTPFILKNIEFDVPVDESLVSMDVPAGYTLKQDQPDFSDVSEADFVESLRIGAQILGDGQFPENVNTGNLMQQVGFLQEKVTVLDCPDEEKGQICMAFAKGLLFIQMFEAHGTGQWHYAGAGVEFGDGETPIFWYQPKDSESWRVIYGDLSIKDVSKENLP
jgi:hypothetical protein